jgi:hypothetical protein
MVYAAAASILPQKNENGGTNVSQISQHEILNKASFACIIFIFHRSLFLHPSSHTLNSDQLGAICSSICAPIQLIVHPFNYSRTHQSLGELQQIF